MGMNKPFKLTPAYKDYLWGGRRLNDDYAKGIDIFPLAETWECSTHPDGQSVVSSGEFEGQLLGDVLKMHPEFMGEHPAKISAGGLPILVKLIDADKDLSVQVHPDDEYAKENENGQLGKSEMWYVLHAKKGAELIYGFNRDVTEEEVREAVKTGVLGKYLQRVPVHKDDIFFIDAGTVHALGAGVLVAEVQESSNLTYRLYDYERIDKTGNKRPLHIDKALKVANLRSSDSPKQPMRVLKYKKGCASELLTRCKYFQVERILLNPETQKLLTDYKTNSNSFEVLLCTDGCGVIEGSENINFFKGDCIFIPASSEELKLHGQAQILKIGC